MIPMGLKQQGLEKQLFIQELWDSLLFVPESSLSNDLREYAGPDYSQCFNRLGFRFIEVSL